MTDPDSPDVQPHEGTAKLQDALVDLEHALDKTFEAAELQARNEDDAGAGLILEQVLDLIYGAFHPIIPYERIGVAVVEENGAVVRSRWARSEADSVSLGIGYAAPLDEEAVQVILGAREPLIVNDLQAYLDEHPDSDPTRMIVEEGMRSSLTCPLVTGDKPVGIIVFSSTEAGVYTEEHKVIFAHVEAHVAAILDRSRLYERLIDLNWQLRVACDALEYQATHDALTRLLNRGAVLEIANQELDRARRQGKPISLVMADVDDFKSINDTHGHLVGDVVLQAVADRLAGALRSYESVGRYGGEEFLITLYDCDAEGATHAMERLRIATGDEDIETSKGRVSLTISLGAATSPTADAGLEEIIRAADEALFEAKEAGRDCHTVKTVEGAGQ